MAEMNSDDQSLKRQVDALTQQAADLKAKKLQMQSAASDQVKAQVQTINDKKARMIDADKKQRVSANNTARAESTYPLDDNIINEKAAVGGFNYEKEINDKLKKMGKADKDSTTAGSSADAPDAKFTHDGEEHHLEVKQNSKAMFGQIELHHDGKKWDISERSKKKYPATHAAIAATGFLNKINKQWDKPTGDYDTDLQKGNVYHTHHDAEPIKSHYGTDRKTNYIQIGGGHGFYHTGNDAGGLGSPELEGKATLRARMKYRGTDRKTGKKKYGALIVMGLKDAEKSHHDLDAPLKEYTTMLQVIESEEIWVSESSLNPKDPHKDYQEKSKVLQGLMLNKDVDQKHVGQRRLDLDKEYAKIKESDEAWAASLEKKKEDHLTPNDKDKLDKVRAMLAKEKKPVKETKYWSKTGKTAKHNETGEETHEYAEYDDEKGDATGKREYRNAKGKSMGESVEQIEEAHKIHDKVEIIKGSAKGTRGHIGEIRHGAFKGAPKQYTVYHGEHDATQVSKEHIRAIKEAVDAMANLRQAHDRHMAKALIANKGGDDAAVKVHQVYMQKIQAKMQKLKRNEETMNEDVEQIDEISKELAGNYYGKVNQQHVKKVGVKPNMYDRVEKDLGKKRKEGLDRAFNRLTKEETMNEEHLIHVSDGSKYGDKPSKKDIDHVMAGVKAHNGEHDGSSDKGAFFKFKSHSDAENFKRHVDKCPGKTCYADHSESTEFTAPSLDETWSKEQLANIKSLHTKMSKSVGLDPTKKYGTIITKSKKDREMDKAIKDEMNEISNATLTSYKQKAGEQASAADKVGDFKKGDKRFSGIVKATKKQFANDLKKEDLDESRGHKVIATFFKNRKSWNKAASERDAKHDEIEKKRQAEKAAGKENMSSAIDRLAKHVNEEGEGGVAANNAGDGKIAGFAGDAGKKAVMSKKILQRKTLGDFKKFVSQEHDEN